MSVKQNPATTQRAEHYPPGTVCFHPASLHDPVEVRRPGETGWRQEQRLAPGKAETLGRHTMPLRL
jgi:hypothetical protein